MKLPKLNLSGIVRDVQRTIGRYSPQILTGIGIAGMLTTVVLSVKATPKALSLIEEKKEELDTDKLTAVETVKTTWKCYIPAVATGVLSTACLISGNSIGTRRTAALAAAYKISETALLEYKDKVIETIGEDQEKVIREKIAQDKVDRNPVVEQHIITTSGDSGEVLCFDPYSSRYFMCNPNKLEAAINKINDEMYSDGYACMDIYYDYIEKLDHTKTSSKTGWNIDSGFIKSDFHSVLTKDNRPCLVVDFDVEPNYNYDRMWY